jgi:hypothetical protein
MVDIPTVEAFANSSIVHPRRARALLHKEGVIVIRLVRTVGAKMRTLIDNAFLERIDRKTDQDFIGGLKLVTDLPLEWLPVCGVPLALRYDVSRIPVMPGNLLIQHCVRPPLTISAAAFKRVLVIRSFGHSDPLAPILERTFQRAYAPLDVEPPEVKFVDVTSEETLVETIESFEGAVLIFDGHGSYEGKFGVGTLVVGGESIDVWSLKEKCRFPPIVIFSACDTHPADGGHGSVANAALALDAYTVLATLLPVDANTSGAFFARLLLRMVEFIKIAADSRTLLTWREVISGMIRMAYTSEVRHILARKAGVQFAAGGHSRVQLVANTAINARRADWFDQFVRAISAETGKDSGAVVSLISRWAFVTDALKYVQLGSPENIVILPEDAIRNASNEFFGPIEQTQQDLDRASGNSVG